jgi:hypothetical protein
MRRRAMRNFEASLRDAGVRIVDHMGATIDDSQFAKEADPGFQEQSVAEYPTWLRQSSDDG